MKFPKSVMILGVRYKVQFISSIPEAQHAAGLFDPDKGVIFILDSLDSKKKRHVLYHEMVHAALFECGVTQTLNHQIEEVCCEVIAKCFLDLAKI